MELIDYYITLVKKGDVIKNMMLVSPEKDLNDLKREEKNCSNSSDTILYENKNPGFKNIIKTREINKNNYCN